MLGLVASVLTAASAHASPTLTSATPWWERITYTISGEGGGESCQYESSLGGARSCNDSETSSPVRPASDSSGAYTKISIERRFNPGSAPDPFELQAGDTLLGGQVMSLAIDATGAVRGCKVLAASGDVRPAYGCDEARAEGFKANASRSMPQVRQGFLTIIVYGHEGQLA